MVSNIRSHREEYANAVMLLCHMRDYIVDKILFSHVLVTSHTYFKLYEFWRFAASSWDTEATAAALVAKASQITGNPQKSVVGTCLPQSAFLYFLKFSPKSGRCLQLSIFNSEPLLLEDGQFHESGFVSINKTQAFILNIVGLLLKENVFLCSLSARGHTHVFPFHLYQIVISIYYLHGIALDLKSRSLEEFLVTSL